MPNVIREARLAVTALLGGPELVLEERIVQGADNGKVVAHRGGEAFRIGGRVVARSLQANQRTRGAAKNVPESVAALTVEELGVLMCL
jgi:hypothetical protein